MTAAFLPPDSVTIADLSREVAIGLLTADDAIGRAYALGFACGMAQRSEDDTARVVRVGVGHVPEIST
jgi:hypothetical protein